MQMLTYLSRTVSVRPDACSHFRDIRPTRLCTNIIVE